MPKNEPTRLSKREQEVTEILYRLDRGTVYDVINEMSAPPSYSSVRTVMGTLVRKGVLRYERIGLNYVYSPTENRKSASRSALKRLLSTFFDNSVDQAVLALLDAGDPQLSEKDIARIKKIIQQSQKTSPPANKP